jgi:hypothetical protein
MLQSMQSLRSRSSFLDYTNALQEAATGSTMVHPNMPADIASTLHDGLFPFARAVVLCNHLQEAAIGSTIMHPNMPAGNVNLNSACCLIPFCPCCVTL